MIGTCRSTGGLAEDLVPARYTEFTSILLASLTYDVKLLLLQAFM